jgi:hypothetical protein
LNFGNSLPKDNPSGLWQLQTKLMAEAERLFGARDCTKLIYQPSWDIEGPHLRYTPNKDGAFAELGYISKSDWKWAVYELAHETVHLLDQHGGDRTHILEEGAAVRFSLDMMAKYGFDSTGLPRLDSYKLALTMFNQLDDDPYSVARDCRSICGNFISIDEVTLKGKCPELDDCLISALLQRPVMR